MSMNIIKGLRSGGARSPETSTSSTPDFLPSQQQRPDTAMAGPKRTRLGFLGAIGYGPKPDAPTAMQAAKVAYRRRDKKQKEPKNIPSDQYPYSTSTEPQSMASRDVLQDQHQHAPQPPLGGDPTIDANESNGARPPPTPIYASEMNHSPFHMNYTATIEKPRSFDTYSPYTKAGSPDAHREYSSANDQGIPRIQELVLRAGYEFPVLQSPPGEAMEDAVTRFLDRYRELSNSCDEAHRSLNQYGAQTASIGSLQTELHRLKNELRASNTEVEDRRKEASDKHQQMIKAQTMLGEQNAKHVQEKSYWESEMENLKYQHKSEMHEETQRLHNENERIKAWYTERLRTARQEEEKRHEKTISSLRQQLTDDHWKWDAHVRQVKDTHEARIKEMQASFNEQMEGEYERHVQQMLQEKERYEGTVNKHHSDIARLKLEAEQEKRGLREQLQTEQESLQEEQKRREKELKRQEAQLTQKHTHEIFQLRTVTEELKQGLFHRKHFKGLRDRDLTNQFRSIVGQVQDFANVEWDNRLTLDWPFNEHQLLDLHRENTRKLKKQIIQNTLWVLLYGHIFASPFRILGLEGRDFDRDWIDIHKSNISSLEWPEVSEDIEKRRYETAKSFLAVMESPARPSGDDLRLKTGYEKSISELLDALHRSLGKVATLEDRQTKVLEGLVRLCARTWIEFCSQPYRLIVSLPGGSGDLLSDARTKERALMLVLSPELKRYGNSQGEHLASGEVIPDCQAAKVSYPIR